MASSSRPKTIYHVFLSFRGPDVHNNFLDHLYMALDLKGIYTYIDSEELRKGEQIESALMKAIEKSQVAIIVFSENYASSSWCLEEVAKIMECKEERDLKVFPVFYKVEPKEVRTPREKYREAMVWHESKFGENSEKVTRWKKALFNAGSLSGWHLKDGDDLEHIQKIVKEITTHLGRRPLDVAKHPVGIDSRVDELNSMLNLDSGVGVLMVGLWGQGGIGKTTLAKAIYNDIFNKFDGSSFLTNVREISKNLKGLVTLQKKLLVEILLRKKRLVVSNVDVGINLIQERLHHKKILLILDDVDNLCQLNALAGKREWFGNGSRIIITTRDKHLLTYLGIYQDHVYEVKALTHNQAYQLLSAHASQTHRTHQIKADLVNGALYYCKGLPLALEVLGSLLCGKIEEVWESTLIKLSKIPDKTINNVLKVSYDGLDENEKRIFLHIACFFKGWTREYTKKVLDSCDFQTAAGFDILIKRSLIRIRSSFFGHESIEMHELIQLMGMDIVNQEHQDDPGRRSRLWLYDDVVDVLAHDTKDCAIKAIVLDLPEPKEMCIVPDAFAKMRWLRLLILRNVHNSFQGPICLPNELRWFEWPGCALPKFSSGEKKLRGLYMSKSNITDVSKQFMDFKSLKYINFSHCESIVCMPDLSGTPNLEELDLRNCKKLENIHESVAYLDKLQVLNLRECSELSFFPNVLNSKKLRALDFCHCTKFERFPNIPHKLEGLKELTLRGTAIKELPTSIENLVALKEMCIHDCKNLEHLPSSIYKLQNLKRLQVEYCMNLIGFPKYDDSIDSCMKTGLSNLCMLSLIGCNLSEVEFLENLSCFPLLNSLYLGENNITTLPTSIQKRHCLSSLGVANCRQLQKIPELPPFWNFLVADNCNSLEKNEDLTSIHHIVRKGLLHLADLRSNFKSRHLPKHSMVLPQGEMPQWVFPIEGNLVSFMISEDFYYKILGVVFCAVLRNDEEQEEIAALSKDKQIGKGTFFIVPHADGFELTCEERCCDSLDSDQDHIFVEYLLPFPLWERVFWDEVDGPHVKFGLEAEGRIVKKWGLRIICEQLGDDLKAELRDNQLIDLALLYEVGHELLDSAFGSSHVHKDNLSEADVQEDSLDCQLSIGLNSQIVLGQEAESSHMHEDSVVEINQRKNSGDCQMSTEEHSQRGSKRKHELIIPPATIREMIGPRQTRREKLDLLVEPSFKKMSSTKKRMQRSSMASRVMKAWSNRKGKKKIAARSFTWGKKHATHGKGVTMDEDFGRNMR